MNPNKPPLDRSGLEVEAQQRRLAELRAQVQLEEQRLERAIERHREQQRQAAIEEERMLQQRLQQLRQDRLSYEQAHSTAHPSSTPAGACVSHDQNSPHPASSPVAVNTRSSPAVPVSQLPSVSQTTVQPQQGRAKKRTTRSASRLTGSLLSQNSDTEPVAKKGQYTMDGSRQQASVLNLGRNVATSSSNKATHETRTLTSSCESTLTGQYSPSNKAQQSVKLTERAKPGSKAEATISTVTGRKAQQSVKLTECAKPGSKAEATISTVTGRKAQQSVKLTECAKPGSEAEATISTVTGHKAQQSIKLTKCAKPGSKAEDKINTVTVRKAQQSVKFTECAKPGSKANLKISTVQKSGTGSKAQKSVKHTECAKPGSKEEDKISTPQKGAPKSLSPQCSSASPTGAPCQKQTQIKLGSEVVNAVTGEPRWLKKLVADLIHEKARYNWKRPDSIIITCLADNPPEDWVQKVTTVVDNIRQSVQDCTAEAV